MSDGLGILLALAAVVGPLLLALYIVHKVLEPRKPLAPPTTRRHK